MKFKAQNTMEIITAVAVVAVIVFSVLVFVNNKNQNLANLSKINNEQVAQNDFSNGENPSFNENIAKNGIDADKVAVKKLDTETAGALSNIVKNMSQEELANKLAGKTKSQLGSASSSKGEDVIDLANKLNKELELNFGEVKREDIDKDIIADLLKISAAAKAKLGNKPNATYTMFNALLGQIIEK